MKQTQTEEGLFQLSSRLMVQERSNFSNFSCVVFNASGGRERETTFEFVPEPEGTRPLRLLSSFLILTRVPLL